MGKLEVTMLFALCLNTGCASVPPPPQAPSPGERRDPLSIVLALPEVYSWSRACAAQDLRLHVMDDGAETSGATCVAVFEDHSTHVVRQATFRVWPSGEIDVLDPVSGDWSPRTR